ncbi:MAG: DUF1648 domain-containing protein [Clostridiales bacterium]|nr:DUF1648 domain-containing protein [Clostridiales bacterium]
MKKSKIIFYILMFLPLILSCAAFNFLPDQIPAHYGLNGEVNRYGSKTEVFILPVIVILFGLFLLLMGKLASKNESNGNTNNQKVTVVSSVMALLVFNVLTVIFLYTSLKQVVNLYAWVDINKAMFSLIGIVFIVIGNFMPRLKRNSIIGLRTKWSLSSDKAWQKSQKFGGVSWIITGFILLVGNAFIFHSIQVYIFSAVVIVTDLIVDVVYTYNVSKQ